MPRRTPYSEIGIRRIKCIRPGCPNRAEYQWQACADNGTYRPMCTTCDVKVNAIVLRFLKPPGWRANIKRYGATKLRTV